MDVLSESKRVRRVAASVVRPGHPWTPAVQTLLRHLASVGFDGAPRVVAQDDTRDDTVSWIDGSVDPALIWDGDGIAALGDLLRRLHDATAPFEPPHDAIWQPSVLRPVGDDQVISHGDAAPWNVVFRDGRPVALIDWELAGPVDRLREIAHTAWLNVRLFDDELAADEGLPGLDERATLLRRFAEGYRLAPGDRGRLVGTMIDVAVLTAAADAWEAMIAPGASAPLGIAWGVAWRARSAAWMITHRGTLERALA